MFNKVKRIVLVIGVFVGIISFMISITDGPVIRKTVPKEITVADTTQQKK